MTQVMVECADGISRPQSDCVLVDGRGWCHLGSTRIAYDGRVCHSDDCVVLVCDTRYAHEDDPELVQLACGAFGLRDESRCIDGEWYDEHDCCVCEVCSQDVHGDDAYSSPGDRMLCQSCMENNCSTCDRCECRVWSDDLIYDEESDHYICQHCASRTRTLIKSYGDKSANIKLPESKDLLLYGVELEVEHKTNAEDGAKYVSKFLDKKYVTFKRDGSLGHTGFEIVTRPDSMDVHKRKFKALFDDRPGKQLTSWSNGRCGMHVHITKSELSQLQLGKMLCFLNEPANTNMISKIAGRKPGRWCRVYKKKVTDIHRPDERYVALNITERTAEVRIFRGTLSQAGFFKNLEFVQALVEFCAPANRGIREAVSAREFCRWLPRKTYPTLHKFLVERGFIVWNHKRKAG